MGAFDTVSLRDLLAKATPRPWKACSANDGHCSCGLLWSVPADVVLLATYVPRDDEISVPIVNDNTQLIAAAVNALPGLLDEMESDKAGADQWHDKCLLARQERDQLRAQIQELEIAFRVG